MYIFLSGKRFTTDYVPSYALEKNPSFLNSSFEQTSEYRKYETLIFLFFFLHRLICPWTGFWDLGLLINVYLTMSKVPQNGAVVNKCRKENIK